MPGSENLTTASDHDVVALAREGDRAAYDEIVRRYGPQVFEFINRMVGHEELAEDLTQETFVKAFSALDRDGPKKKPSAWFLRIANNTAVDYVRRKRPDSTRSPLTVTPGEIERRALRILKTPPDTPPPTPTPGTDLSESVAAITRALRKLRPEYRECFVLHYVEELSYDEIADTLDLPLGTVKSRLNRAREELRGMIKEETVRGGQRR
jgi:RNA polymerase sigma factor (sigma-70 family)